MKLKFSQPQQVDKILLTRWCLDPSDAEPGESYDETDAQGEPLGPQGGGDNMAQGSGEDVVVDEAPLPIYGVEDRQGRQHRQGRRRNFRGRQN